MKGLSVERPWQRSVDGGMAAETEELLSGSWVARGQGKSCVEWEGEMAVTTRGAEVGVSALFRGAEPCPTTSHGLRRFRGAVVGTGGCTFGLHVAGCIDVALFLGLDLFRFSCNGICSGSWRTAKREE